MRPWKTCIGSLWTALVLTLCAPPLWAQEGGCFALSQPSQGVDRMVVTRAGEMWYVLAGYPQVVHAIACPMTGRSENTCQIECDGGAITMVHAPDAMQVTTEGVRIEQILFESILVVSDAFGGLSLQGDWRLDPAPDTECTKILDAAPAILLGPGDIAAVVAELEQFLLVGGYFIGGPDVLFDADTAQAVSLYQADTGLAVTGRVDRALISRLRLAAASGFGSC